MGRLTMGRSIPIGKEISNRRYHFLQGFKRWISTGRDCKKDIPFRRTNGN